MNADALYGSTGSASSPSPANDLYGDPKKKKTNAGQPDILGTILHKLGSVAGAGATTLDRLGAPKVIDILDRPRQTVQAAIAGDDPLGTFLHHASPEQQDRDREIVRKKMGLPGDAERAQAHGLRGGVDDFALDTLTDPMSLAGGFIFRGAGKAIGGARRAIGSTAAKVAPATAKKAIDLGHIITDPFTYGGSAKRNLGEPLYNKALAADNRQAAREEEATRRLTDRFEQHISKLGEDDKRTVYQILNGERQMTDPASGRLTVAPHVADAVAHARKLTNDMAALQGDESARRKLAYGGGKLARTVRTPERPPKTPVASIDDLNASTVDKRGDYLSRLASSLFADGENGVLADGGSAIEKNIGGPRKLKGRVDRQYALPDDLKDFAAPANQGILGAGNLRSKYLPGPHNAEALDPDRPAQSFNLLRPFAPNSLRREEFSVGEHTDDLGKIGEAFRGAIRNAARQGTAGRLRDELSVPLKLKGNNAEPDALNKLFEQTTRAKGNARSGMEKLGDFLQPIVDFPKNTVTTLGLKHGLVNVPALALAAEGPGAAWESLEPARRAAAHALTAGKAFKPRTAAELYDRHGAAVEGGVITPFADRKNPIVDLIGRTPQLARAGIGAAVGGAGGFQNAQSHDENPLLGTLVGAAIGAGAGKYAPQLSRGANQLTWAIDDAAKATVLKRKLARGMHPDEAAAETMREMVDYRHRSDATRVASKAAPFATFRTRIPAAVASATTRDPKRALALDRASQGLFTNGNVQIGTNDDGTPRKLPLTTPTSDVLGGIDEPQRYARAMLADPAKAVLSPVAMHTNRFDPASRDMKNRLQDRYFTYG